nr:prepilin peptidase [Microlunatus antarcticus]
MCGPALVLVAIDARTTWLPLGLTRAVWVLTAGAAVPATFLGGVPLLVRSAAGAGAAALLYLLLWRLSRGGLGFGDVRLAPVLGAATAAAGWSTLVAALLLGSLVGAAVGVVLALRGRPGAFPYAPSMLAGAFLACGVRALSG